MSRVVLQSCLHMCTEGKDLCSEILAVLINTGCAQLIDNELAEHRVRQLEITQTMVRTHQLDWSCWQNR